MVPKKNIKSDNTVKSGSKMIKKPMKRKKTSGKIPKSPIILDVINESTKSSVTSVTTSGISETFHCERDGNYNFKISSWNVAGIRSWIKKGQLQFFQHEDPDILCLQETKCVEEQLPPEAKNINGYYSYWYCKPGGYAGVCIYTKIKPQDVQYGIGNLEYDKDSRVITAEYENFFLLNVYVPNSGRKLVNLDFRMKWDKLFVNYVQRLDSKKPVIICGDMNVSHNEIDLANPKTNTRNAGFTKEERDNMSHLLSVGFVDSFRYLYPDKRDAYTFWTYMGNARKRNIGWRLDYFIVSERLLNCVVDSCIRSNCLGSDHCPITLFLNI